MENKRTLLFSPSILLSNEQKLLNFYKLIAELDKSGFILENGKIVFDDKDEEIIKEIFDKYCIPFKI